MMAFKNLRITSILVVSILWLFIYGCAKQNKSSGEKLYTIDLNNDGKNEIIRIRQLKVDVLDQSKKKLGSFGIFDYSDQLEFIDLNKDGKKQIVLWTQGKEGYSKSLVIYGLDNNGLREIFKLDVNGNIETDFQSMLPRVKSGFTTWVWNGEQFVQQNN